jgi:hypothetical protein
MSHNGIKKNRIFKCREYRMFFCLLLINLMINVSIKSIYMADNWKELNDIPQQSSTLFSKYVGCFIHILVILSLLWLIIMILSMGKFEL